MEYRASRATLRAIPEPYEILPTMTRVFYQVAEIQAAAMRLLVAGGLIEKDALESGVVRIIEAKGEKERALYTAMEKLSYRTETWYAFVAECLVSYPLNGHGGLKERTGLMEHRHDYA